MRKSKFSESQIVKILKAVEGVSAVRTFGTIGNSLGTVIPKDILVRLKIEEGESQYLGETPGGSWLTPYDADFESKVPLTEHITREDRDMLRELSKR